MYQGQRPETFAVEVVNSYVVEEPDEPVHGNMRQVQAAIPVQPQSAPQPAHLIVQAPVDEFGFMDETRPPTQQEQPKHNVPVDLFGLPADLFLTPTSAPPVSDASQQPTAPPRHQKSLSMGTNRNQQQKPYLPYYMQPRYTTTTQQSPLQQPNGSGNARPMGSSYPNYNVSPHARLGRTSAPIQPLQSQDPFAGLVQLPNKKN